MIGARAKGCHRTVTDCANYRDGLETDFCNVNMTTNNINVKMPPMLPTTPLPLNVVTSNVMYMYSCSQCEFKTHIESLFKQHVDSVHLGIPNVPNNLVLGQSVQQQTVGVAGQTSTATASIVSAVAASPSPASPVSVAVTSPQAVTLPLQSGLISVTQATPQTLVMSSGGQLLATGGQLGSATAIVNPQGHTTAVMSGGADKLHKCPKCNVLLPSKNQLTLHKRKVHGKVAMAAATGGAGLTQSPTGPVTYAVVSSPGPATVQPSSASVVASLVSQVSQQPVSILAQAAAAAQAAAVASAGGGAGTVPTGTPAGVHTSTNITGKKTYSCSACGYSTTRRDGLSQHYDSVHLKIKNHQCELCPYAASQKGTLNRHVKLRHKKKVEVLS